MAIEKLTPPKFRWDHKFDAQLIDPNGRVVNVEAAHYEGQNCYGIREFDDDGDVYWRKVTDHADATALMIQHQMRALKLVVDYDR